LRRTHAYLFADALADYHLNSNSCTHCRHDSYHHTNRQTYSDSDCDSDGNSDSRYYTGAQP